MNAVLDAIKARRAIRKFRPDMVEKEKIDAVIEAGLYAASGKGTQSPIIIAVTDKDFRDRLSVVNRDIGGWDAPFDPFYGAPVVLCVVVSEEFRTRVYDGSMCIGNMMLDTEGNRSGNAAEGGASCRRRPLRGYRFLYLRLSRGGASCGRAPPRGPRALYRLRS